MIITDFVLFAETVDRPGSSTAGMKTASGNIYSIDGIINAMVDIKLEKYFKDNDISPQVDTFESLKYTPGEIQLRKEIRGNYEDCK